MPQMKICIVLPVRPSTRKARIPPSLSCGVFVLHGDAATFGFIRVGYSTHPVREIAQDLPSFAKGNQGQNRSSVEKWGGCIFPYNLHAAPSPLLVIPPAADWNLVNLAGFANRVRESGRLLKNSFTLRLLKKAQPQGGTPQPE
jgi:hypothetical protein